MSFQNTIKCMKKYNRYAVRNNVRAEGREEEEAVNCEVVKQCFKLNEILDDMKNVNFEDVEIGENEETIHSPRIANLKKKKEEIDYVNSNMEMLKKRLIFIGVIKLKLKNLKEGAFFAIPVYVESTTTSDFSRR